MAFTVSPPLIRSIGGVRHVSVDITELDVGSDDEWAVAVPPFFQLTLVHVALDGDAGGAATTVNPALGLEAGWADGLSALIQNSAPAAVVRNQDRVTVVAPGGILRGRSRPNADAGRVRTRLAWTEGHA